MQALELRLVFAPRRGEQLDFVVSGRSLYQELTRRGYDVVPRLGSKLGGGRRNTRPAVAGK